MEKTKLLTIAVIGLLIINLGTLGFLVMNGKGHRQPLENRAKPKEIIIEKLHFDVTQLKIFDKLIELHRGKITNLDNNIRQAKNELYATLNQPEVNIKTKDSLIGVINSNQKQIEETHFKHFEAIKNLCHKDQMENFNELTEELSKIFAPKPRRPKHD